MTAPIPIGAGERRRQLQVWRSDLADDGAGGQVATLVQVGTVQALVSQPSAAEQVVAAQAGAALTHVVYFGPADDVQRGDELRGDGDTFRVKATVVPSEAVYLRADVERIQHEPGDEGS